MIFKGKFTVTDFFEIFENDTLPRFLEVYAPGEYAIEIEVFPKWSQKGDIFVEYASWRGDYELTTNKKHSYACREGLLKVFPTMLDFLDNTQEFEANILKLEKV